MSLGTGMTGVHSPIAQKDEWLTPPDLLDSLGTFDLDPCASVQRPWPTARHHYTIEDDGLTQPWLGRVWLNPPYGVKASVWLEKLSIHGNGIALIFARTETDMFFRYVWGRADALFFFDHRLTFYHANGNIAEHNGGAPSCLIAYGRDNVDCLRCLKGGAFIECWQVREP